MGYTVICITYSFTLNHLPNTEYSDVQYMTCYTIIRSSGAIARWFSTVANYGYLPGPSNTCHLLFNPHLCS